MKRSKLYNDEISFDYNYQVETFIHIISKEEEKWLKTKNGIFFKACFENDTNTIKTILDNLGKEKLEFYQKSNNKYIHIPYIISKPSPLHISCMEGNVEAMQVIFEKINEIDANEEINSELNLNLLHTAVYFKKLNVVKFLIREKKINVKKKNIIGNNCLHICAESRNLEAMEFLINEKKNLNPNQKNNNGEDCLHISTEWGNLEAMKYLIEKKGMDPKQPNRNGNNCLHIASIKGNMDCLKYLINIKKMDPHKKNQDGDNCLHICSRWAQLEPLKFLIKKIKGMDKKITNKSGDNCLHICSSWGNVEAMKFLILENGMKPELQNDDGYNSLHICSRWGKLDALKFLVEERNMNPSKTNNKLENCLHLHISHGIINVQVIKYLLQKKVPLSLNSSNESPLDLAYRNYNKNAIEIFEKHIHSEIDKIEKEDYLVVSEMNKKIEDVKNEYAPIREKLKNKKIELIKTLKHKKREEEDHERLERISKEIEKQENHQKDISTFYQKENFIDFHHKLNKKDQIFEDKGVFKENKSDLEEGILKEFKKSHGREIIRIDLKQDDVLFKFLESIKLNFLLFWKNIKKFRKIENQKLVVKKFIEYTFIFFENPSYKKKFENIMNEITRDSVSLQEKKKRNWLYLGEFYKNGVCRHRSLLFKLICDEIGIKCRVYRGLQDGHLHNFNVIQLTDGKLFIVDTMNVFFKPESALSSLNLKTFNKITNLQNSHKENPKFDQVKTLQLKKKCDTKLIKDDFFKEFNSEEQHYVKRKFISSGGFGSIYSFPLLKVDGHDIVVKEINIQKISSSTGFSNEVVKKYVEKEIFFMKFLCHPNIIKIFDHFKIKNELNKDVYGLIMKKYTFDGNKFLELLKTYELEKQAIEFLVMILKLAKGLKYLHDIEIIHLDLKPQNILLDFNIVEREIEDLVLTDFGCSKEKTRLYLHTFTFGTPKYCGPEIMEKEVFNEMADIYSFGKIMKDFAFCFEYWNENLNILMKKCLDKDRKSRPTTKQIIEVLKKELEGVRKRVKEKRFPKELNEMFKKKYRKKYEINRNNFYKIFPKMKLKNKFKQNPQIIKEINLVRPHKNIKESFFLCSVCKNNTHKMKICSCKTVYYCSKDCQKKDWIFHKKNCLPLNF